MDDLTIILTSSVIASAVTVLGTQGFTLWFQHRVKQSSAIFSAIRVATTLEAFVLKCVNRLGDHEAYKDSKGAIGSQSMRLPDFPAYPSDIAWQTLPPELTERALTLPNEVELESRDMVEFMESVDGPHETDHAVEATATRGMEALELAGDLRRRFNHRAFVGATESYRALHHQLEAQTRKR